MTGDYQAFLEFLIKAIVDNPDDVKIERKVDEMGVLLSLKVNPQDMGQVIGRQGATAKSIRSLLRIVGVKNNARVNLKIEEPEGSTRFNQPSEGVQKVVEDLKF
ncbi:MAG: KH domain-containing protein [bacterium]|nr:KH domain-containing protein [bacterium]